MNDSETPEAAEVAEPLAERLPRYAVAFAVGAAVALLVGAVWGLSTATAMLDALSWSLMLAGVALLLVGGASGGGYTNLGLGAFGSLFGTGRRYDEDPDDADVRMGARRRVDPHERLRQGLRPGPNPTAFWQVIGGFAYIGLGILLIETFA